MFVENWGLLCLLVAVAWPCFAVLRAVTSPLRSVPGPFWARFSRLWLFRKVWQGHFEADNIKLHRQYGPVVRVAPGWYSIDLPDAVPAVYGIGSKLPKADWYDGWKHPSPDRWTMFPDRDVKRHAETRRRFQALYSLSSLVTYEAYVDECEALLQARLREFASKEEEINLVHWLQCYAFDVIGDITYSKRFGFLDDGKDRSGLLAALQKVMTYSTLVGIYVSLHPFLYATMEFLGVGGGSGRTTLMKFVHSSVEKRVGDRKTDGVKQTKDENAPMDFLDKLLNQNEDNPGKVTMYHVFMMGLSNIIAGSDTTAVTLSAILYNLINNPRVLKKLREEIDNAADEGKFSVDGHPLSFKDSRDMPYLQVVVKEAMRMHAATGLPLWREVPAGGMEIGGRFFPAGSVVGLNTWCAHYNQDVFGTDAGEFRPERWLDADEATLSRMNAYYMPVSQTCLQLGARRILIARFIVWSGLPNVYWTTHFRLGDVKGSPSNCKRVRF